MTFRRILLILIAWGLAGCSGPTLRMRPLRYDVELTLDPATSVVEGRTRAELTAIDGEPLQAGRGVLELALNSELELLSVTADGATLVSRKGALGKGLVRLVLRDPQATVRLDVSYRGKLWQDVTAGEVEGQVHNFEMSAHVGPAGIYLEPSGLWYPQVELPDGAAPDLSLSEFTLAVDPVEGFELVAGLESEPRDEAGRLRWRSPFPLEGLVLLGGPLERHSRTHRGIALHAVLAPGKAAVAEDILAASAEYLDRYEPLIGPYPFSEFTVLEAFFSSGFAFPTCTQIAGSQLSEYRQYRRHGYLDHELLHNWWGNGILVDPADGNWCEGLASYMGNYAGFVLDGDEQGARKQRRNQSSFLSSIADEDDLPLGTFGLEDGAGRGIGYQKGAAVFHLLERKIGPDALLAGLQRLTAEQMGRHIGWTEFQQVLESETGQDLTRFFDQWVRGRGAPELRLVDARWSPGASRAQVTLTQGDADFELDVPLRLIYEDRSEDRVVSIDRPRQTVELPTATQGLVAVELDPDFHLFRKLGPEETMPTSNLTRRGDRLLIVLPEGEPAEGYRTAADSFRTAVIGESDDEPAGQVRELTPDELTEEDLEDTGVLILGAAVQSEIVQRFLARTSSPVRWQPSAFAVEDKHYADSGQAIFLTVHHPEQADSGVTVYYGNSAEALSNAGVLSYYANSLLVFDTPTGQPSTDGSGMPRAEVIRRIDFEYPDRIEF